MREKNFKKRSWFRVIISDSFSHSLNVFALFTVILSWNSANEFIYEPNKMISKEMTL